MSEKVINIARNTSYYTLALIVQKVISFSYFVVIARALGPDDLGQYYFAMSFTTIFAILIDLGLANVLTREVASGRLDAAKTLNNNLGLKSLFTLVTVVLVVGAANLFNYSPLAKTLIYISSISMVLDSFTLTFFAVMRGFHNLKFESISSMIFQLIVLISGLISLKLGWGLMWLMVALALASVFNFLYSLATVIFKAKIKIKLELDWQFAKQLAFVTWPFALFAIFQRIYTYIDSVMLQQLAGSYSVGIYQVAFKIITALQFLPMAFSASLYPAFASYWHKNREQLAVTFERAINYLLIISVPIGIGIMVVADKIVALFSHGYVSAVLPLQIEIASLFFVFLNFAIGALFNACDRQMINTKIIAFATFVCVLVNWLLIPKYGALGATIADSLTNTLIFLIGLFYIHGIVKLKYLRLLGRAAKIIFGGLVMGYLAFVLKEHLNVFVVITISGLIYFVLLFVLQVFKREDVLSIIASFRRKPVTNNV